MQQGLLHALSSKLLKGGCIGDYAGECYRDTRSLNCSSREVMDPDNGRRSNPHRTAMT